MKLTKVITAVPAVFLLVSCAGTDVTTRNWVHNSLSDNQRQQEVDRCMAAGAEAEREYMAANTRGTMNSNTWAVPDMGHKAKAKTARQETLESCLQSAGFTRR